MKKNLTHAFLTTLVFLLLVIHTSCSDDKESTPVDTSEILLFPERIEIIDEDGLPYSTYTFTYNENNRLVKATDILYNEEDIIFKYDEEGRLIEVSDIKYTYDDSAKTVFANKEYENSLYFLNDKEQPTREEKNESSSFLTRAYNFDSSNNLLTILEESKEGVKLSESSFTYYNEYSPFKNMNLPIFFMLDDDYFGIQTMGTNMVKSVTYTSSYGENIESYSIIETLKNYPTEIKEVVTYKNDQKTEKQEYTYKITYKEVK